MPDTSLIMPLLWQSVLLPFGVALAAGAAARALHLQGAGTAVAVTAGFLASFAATLGAHWKPVPVAALDWTPWIALATLVAALATGKVAHGGARFVARLVFAAAAASLVVLPAVQTIGMQKAAAGITATAVLTAVVWTAVASVSHGGAGRPLLLAVVTGGAGLAMMVDSSQSAGRLGGAMAAALAACTVFHARMPFAPPAAGVAVMLLGTLLANAFFYGGFPAGYVALLAGALLVEPGLTALHRLRRNGADRPGWLPAAVLTAIPVMAVVALALRAARDLVGS